MIAALTVALTPAAPPHQHSSGACLPGMPPEACAAADAATVRLLTTVDPSRVDPSYWRTQLDDARRAAERAHDRVKTTQQEAREVAASARKARNAAKDKEEKAREKLLDTLAAEYNPQLSGLRGELSGAQLQQQEQEQQQQQQQQQGPRVFSADTGQMVAAKPPEWDKAQGLEKFFCLSHCAAAVAAAEDQKHPRACATIGCASCPECADRPYWEAWQQQQESMYVSEVEEDVEEAGDDAQAANANAAGADTNGPVYYDDEAARRVKQREAKAEEAKAGEDNLELAKWRNVDLANTTGLPEDFVGVRSPAISEDRAWLDKEEAVAGLTTTKKAPTRQLKAPTPATRLASRRKEERA